MKEKRLISRKEAAKLLGCTAQSVSNWVKWGLITEHKTKTGELLIDRKTIEQYFDTLQDMVAIERKKAEVKALNEQLDRQIHEALSCLRITTFWGRTTRVINTIVTKLVPAYMREKRDYQFTMKLLEGQSVNQIADDGGLSPARVLQIINKFARRLYSAPNLVELEAKNEEMTQKYRDLEIKYNGLLQAYKSGVQSNIDELDFKNPIYDIKLFDCNLTVRCLNCMKAAGIETIGDLVSYEKYEVLRFRHFGKKSLTELEELLWSKGLKWGMNKK